VSSEESKPQYRYGTLWGILALLLLVGIVASAFFVYGLTDLFATGRALWDVPILLVGGFVATVMLLLVIGILYRVDRVRGVPHRRVELFD
jgi:hypothetical protein